MSAPRTFPLTTVERRFWLLHHLHPEAPVANIGRVVSLKGELWPDDLARAFAVVADNPVLRMRVVEVDGEPRGFLGEATRLVVDPDIADDATIDAAARDVVTTPYDLEHGPLIRARLLRRGDDDHVLVLGAHHLILDGWGLSRSLPRALARAMRGEQMTFGDEDALDDDHWIDTRLAHGSDDPDPALHARDREHWQRRLADAQAVALPIVTPPPPRASGKAFDVEVPLSSTLFARATELAKRVGARPVHVFLAAYVVELARSTRTRDLLLGTTRASRPSDDPDNHEMGCFVRTKALRVALGGDDSDDVSFVDVVALARAAVRESLEHGAFDAEELHTIGAPPPAALFNFIPFSAFDGVIPGVDINAGRIIAGGTAFPISLTIDEKGAPPRLVLEVEADLFDEGFARRFADRILAVLDDGLSRPDIPHHRLLRLGDVDRAAMATNAPTTTQQAFIVGGHLGCAVAEDLASGDDNALVFVRDPLDASADVVVDRPTLLHRARAIAASLAAEGVGPGHFVGVRCLEPVHSVEAICGVLFAGAAFVPIDPAAPPVRLAAIVEQARLTIVLDDDAVAARAQTSIDDDDVLSIPGSDDDAAYAIFTSGSTGTPKGVVISHRAVMAQKQARDALGFPHVERSLLLAPFFFDGCIETVFQSLTTGGTMYLLDEQGRRDPLTIRRALSRRRITYTSAVPALWGAMLDAAGVDDEPLTALSFVIVGGEKLTPQLIDKHRTHSAARLVNEYGPTESTVFSSSWTAPSRGTPLPARIPIGRSAPHVLCTVVDEHLQPVPVLEAGELIVSGPGLADGYLHAPALTAAAFVDVDGHRVYRTGDIVRLWPDGELEWLARKDEQVKLRGLRVEPGEVEAAILLEGAAECAVVVDGNNLIAWVTPDSIDEAALITALQLRLPEAMIPARIVTLATMPKTANDKIDKRALPRVFVDDVVVAADTETERVVAEVWAAVLELPSVGVTRSFFAYGGHSLKAAVVVRRLSDRFGVDVTLSSLMAARTVRELARVIDGKRISSSGAAPSSSLLLPLTGKPLAKRPDVIFLPGIGGHVFTFAPIAERMQSHAVGLRTWGSEPGEEPLPTVEALAARNLAILDEAGVGDDVVFAGYSFGGLVAWEMALQRSMQGRAPRHLVIFDTMAPGYPKKLPPWTRAMMHAESLARTDWAGRVAYLKDRVDSVRTKLNFKLQRADAFAADNFAVDAAELAALPPAQRAQLERLAGVSTIAHHAYWPRSSSTVPLLLFAAEQGFEWAATVMDDPWLGWRAWCSGPRDIERVELAGSHLKLFMADNLDITASTLDDLVRRR